MVSGLRGGSGGHELGRRRLWALSRDCEETEKLLDHSQTLITAFFHPVAPASTAPVTEEDQQATPVRRASHRAVAQFWCFLQDFVGQRYAPEEWRAVAATHPFIGVLAEGERDGLLLMINCLLNCSSAVHFISASLPRAAGSTPLLEPVGGHSGTNAAAGTGRWAQRDQRRCWYR